MKSIWNKNIALFSSRFPSFFCLIEKEINFFSEKVETEKEAELYPFWEVFNAKNGTISVKENSHPLHSAYNPEREAESLISLRKSEIENATALVFNGFGLLYAPIKAAALFPKKTLILIEPDINRFLAALLFTDAEKLFTHNSLILACGIPTNEVITLLSQNGILNSVFFSNSSQTEHAKSYFLELSLLVERNRNKEKINNATLEKFRSLWFRNSKRNIYTTATAESVDIYKNKAKNLPFLVLGAGPSLKNILDSLNELKKRMIIVCVDTALNALLKKDVQPDFIVLTDPQYWAYRHIAGLKSPESILITENVAYPSVFNFECKKIVCCKSQIPVAHFFEEYCGNQSYLGSGGSVASCAWTFAEFSGADRIFLCGLDLSFPKKQTHIKGSTFEQGVFKTSSKIKPAETASLPLLFGGNVILEKDFNKNPVLTDQKMKMFAWWFESSIAKCKTAKTFTLSPEGLYIPGVEVFDLKNLFSLSDISSQKKEFLELSEPDFKKEEKKINFEKAKNAFNGELNKACELCSKALKNIDTPDFCAEKYKEQLDLLKIDKILALAIPKSNQKLSKKENDIQFFKATEDFCKKYQL